MTGWGSYCHYQAALPAGYDPALLPDDHPMYRADRLEECALRCRAQAWRKSDSIVDSAFTVKIDGQNCRCGALHNSDPSPCDTLAVDSNLATYNMAFAGTCVAPTCSDGARNGDEVGVDCGGSCAACAAGKCCAENSDCASGVCKLYTDSSSVPCRVDITPRGPSTFCRTLF